MKKIDLLSLSLSIIINLLFLLCIPGLDVETIMDKKIKVGMVAFDNDKKIKIDSKKTENSNRKDRNLSNEKTGESSKDDTKADSQDGIDLNKLSESISMPEVNILATEASNRTTDSFTYDYRKEKVMTTGIEAPLEKREVNIEPVNNTMNTEIKEKNETFQTESLAEKIEFNSEIGNDMVFDRLLVKEDGVEGLPSGYKLGTEDGNVVARWDSSNKEPVYPEKAQLRGMHGVVKIRMTIDENGNILSFVLEKGSGVPEINQAIEEVGRSWKIYLSRNGLNVKGDVELEYTFTLKGQE